MANVVDVLKGRCTPNQVVDALILSIAVYEEKHEDAFAVWGSKQDLPAPVGLLERFPAWEDNVCAATKKCFMVARSSHGHVVVSCRGTCGFDDLLQDLKFVHTRLPFVEGSAHLGFMERAQSISVTLFTKLLLDGETIVFTGHSLGGAVAALLTMRVILAASEAGSFSRSQIRCITFGAPLFADPDLAETINTHFKDLFYHVVSRNDCVPKILPLMSTIQRMLHGPEDSLETLRLCSRMTLDVAERVTRMPIATALRAVERIIPWPIHAILRGVLKLAWPGRNWLSYHHAGHVLMVDADGGAELVADMERLNWWAHQMVFALGILNPLSVTAHCMTHYYRCLVRRMSSAVSSVSSVLPLPLHHHHHHRDNKDNQLRLPSPDASAVNITMAVAAATSAATQSEVEKGAGRMGIVDMPVVEMPPWGDQGNTHGVSITCSPGGTRTVSVGNVETEDGSGSVQCGSDDCVQREQSLPVLTLSGHTQSIISLSKDRPYKRKRLRFFWVFATIGKVSRHVRSLDRIILIYSVSTFLRIVL